MTSPAGDAGGASEYHAALAALGADLQALKREAGLTYRMLARATLYSSSTVAAAAAGRQLPSLEVTLAFVKACGGDVGNVSAWRRRWTDVRRLGETHAASARRLPGNAADPGQVSTQAELTAAMRALWAETGRSYSDLERMSGGQLRKSTLSDMLNGRVVPRADTMRAFIAACQSSRPGGTIDALEWRRAAERARVAAERAPAVPRRTPVVACDPYELGVHRAGGGLALPFYVHRGAAEIQLRQVLGGAREQGGFILLVGHSGAGKTRLAFEAAVETVGDFGLVHPVVPAELGSGVSPRTVVWLDDIDRYLRGGLDRPSLQALLRGPQPVIVLATIWPSQYHAYLALPHPGTSDDHQRERETLALATVIDVSTTLSPAELASARAAAQHDPILAAALDAADHCVFQTLAAGPHLARRRDHAPDPYSAALITAAVDASRAGAAEPLAVGLLFETAQGRLTDTERARAPEDWFENALAYATAPVLGGISALTPVRAAAGTGRPDGYHVADYLVAQRREPKEHAPADADTAGEQAAALGYQHALGHAARCGSPCLHPEDLARAAGLIAPVAGRTGAPYRHVFGYALVLEQLSEHTRSLADMEHAIRWLRRAADHAAAPARARRHALNVMSQMHVLRGAVLEGGDAAAPLAQQTALPQFVMMIGEFVMQEPIPPSWQSRKFADVPHGTPSGYRDWGCRCEQCTLVRAAETRERQRKRRAETQ